MTIQELLQTPSCVHDVGESHRRLHGRLGNARRRRQKVGPNRSETPHDWGVFDLKRFDFSSSIVQNHALPQPEALLWQVDTRDMLELSCLPISIIHTGIEGIE